MSTDYYIYIKPVPLILLTARSTLPDVYRTLHNQNNANRLAAATAGNFIRSCKYRNKVSMHLKLRCR